MRSLDSNHSRSDCQKKALPCLPSAPSTRLALWPCMKSIQGPSARKLVHVFPFAFVCAQIQRSDRQSKSAPASLVFGFGLHPTCKER